MTVKSIIVVYTLEDENYTIISNSIRDCFGTLCLAMTVNKPFFCHCEQSEAISYFDTRCWKTHQPRL